MENLYVCRAENEDCEQRQKIILGSNELWSAQDLHDCSEDASLDRDLTNSSQMLNFAETLRMADYVIINIDFGCEEDDFFDFDGDKSVEILKKYNQSK